MLARGLYPKERRLTSRRGLRGSSVSPVVAVVAVVMVDAAVLPLTRLRELRIVTVLGTLPFAPAPIPSALRRPSRGLARSGVAVGAGSLDRAECTRCSSFCMLPMRPRIW